MSRKRSHAPHALSMLLVVLPKRPASTPCWFNPLSRAASWDSCAAALGDWRERGRRGERGEPILGGGSRDQWRSVESSSFISGTGTTSGSTACRWSHARTGGLELCCDPLRSAALCCGLRGSGDPPDARRALAGSLRSLLSGPVPLALHHTSAAPSFCLLPFSCVVPRGIVALDVRMASRLVDS